MAKLSIVRAQAAEKTVTQNVVTPWACHRAADGINIDAYVEAAGEWSTIARTLPSGAVDPRKVAEHIVKAVNEYEKTRELLSEMASALEACLDCSGLDFTAEHDAEVSLNRYREMALRKKA